MLFIETFIQFEYGNSELLHILAQDIIEPLKKSFYDRWKEIIACSIVKTIQPLPLRLIKSRWEKLHISQKEFFDELMVDSKTLIFETNKLYVVFFNI